MISGDPPPITRSQIDKLGQRLKNSATPDDADLTFLARYQESLGTLLIRTRAEIAQLFAEALPNEVFDPMARVKQSRSVVAKLRRLKSKLSSMQDLVGFRIVVPTAVQQEIFFDHLPTEGEWRLVDRRKSPSHGYRAIHVIHNHKGGSVEV